MYINSNILKIISSILYNIEEIKEIISDFENNQKKQTKYETDKIIFEDIKKNVKLNNILEKTWEFI